MASANGDATEVRGSHEQASSTQAAPDTGKLKRQQRQPRNTACQSCVALKMKCVRPADASGACERCARADRECVPAIPKPRKRRTGVAVELDGALRSLVDAPPTIDAPAKFDAPRPPSSDSQAETSKLLSRHDLSHNGSSSFVKLFARSLGNVAACVELLRGVDYSFVANCFTIFRHLTMHFPFVEVPPSADVVSMVAKKPLLTLAVCTVASSAQPEVQRRLTQAFQFSLSSKSIIHSERNLDLFTGLLTYVAWHHHYLPHKHIYLHLALLASIAADLGLYHPASKVSQPEDCLERNRAFVGCYYLCSALSACGFDRPNPMRWTVNLRRFAEKAAFSGGLSSDQNLVSILELAKVLDDFEEHVREESLLRTSTTDPQLLDLESKVAIQRLKALKREHPSLGGTLVFAAANIHMHQRQLQTVGVTNSSVLIQCACAVKEYMDDVLARAPSTLHQISIVDWVYLVEILILMARISRPSTDAPDWAGGAVHSMLQPELALENICSHMASAQANDPLSPRHEPLLDILRRVCQGIREHIVDDGDANDPVDAQRSSFGSGILGLAFLNAV